MPFISANGLRIYYEKRGSGPRLLSISGTGGDLRRSPSIFDSPLAGLFEILAYDQRGLGRTSKPDQAYTMADYADDAAALLDAVGWDDCRVMGFSFGGMVAQELALRHPRRVARLVLACTSCGGAGGDSYPLHELPELSMEQYAHRILMLADTRRDDAWLAGHPQEYQTLLEQSLANMRVGEGEPGRNMGARRQIEARRGHNTCDRLTSLLMPVYICGGRYDGIAAPQNLAALQQQIPGSRMELFDGGHLFHLQDPKAFEHIAAFLLETA